MTLLEVMIKEYLSIMDYLTKHEPIENERIVLDRETFKQYLAKYAYIPFSQKIRFYKDLNLIIHDKGNYTFPHRDRNTGKIERKVILNYQTYKTIRDGYNREIDI